MYKFLYLLKKEKTFLFFIFLSALLFRSVYVLQTADISDTDVDGYPDIAVNMVEGHGFSSEAGRLTSYRPPLYPFWDEGYSGVGLIQAVFSALTVVLVYLIGKEVFGESVGRLSAAVTVIYPFFIYYTGNLMTETLFTFIFTLFILYLVRVSRTFSGEASMVTGCIFGLSVLCRPAALAFIPFIPAGMFLVLEGNRKNKVISLSIITAVFLIVMSPWVIRNWQVHGKFVFTTTHGGYTLLLGNNSSFYQNVVTGEAQGGLWPEEEFDNWQMKLSEETKVLSETERNKYYYSEAISFMKADFGRCMRMSFFKLLRFWRFFPHTGPSVYKIISLFSYVPILIFAFVGMITSRRLWKKVFFLYAVPVTFSVTHAIFWSQIRFRLPVMPFLIIFASFGVLVLYNKFSKGGYYPEHD